MSDTSRIRFGFHKKDELYLRRHDNAAADPDLQIFSDQDPDEDNEDKKYFCAMCKTRLDYLQGVEEWFCSGCLQHYDTRIQDKPLTDTTDFKLIPYSDLMRYPTFDENDPNLPFVEPINVDELAGEVEEVEIVKQSADRRVQHIRVKGSPVEAMAAMNEMDEE